MKKKQKKKEYISPELQVHYIEMVNGIGIQTLLLNNTIESPSEIINPRQYKDSKAMKKN